MASIPEKLTYEMVGAENEGAIENVYEHLKSFWFARHNIQEDEAVVEALLNDYRKTYFKEDRAPIGELLKGFCTERDGEGGLSLIEVGGANGTTLHYLKSIMELENVRYLGVEPYDRFRDDFESHFPEQRIIDGNVEDFGEVDFPSLIPTPVTAVLCFGVLCMTPPRVASAFLKAASELTDDILGFDYCLNFEGTFPPHTQWLFEYSEENGQYYFVHQFRKYLDDIGFEVVQKEHLPFSDGMHGWEVFHFRRRK